MIIKHLSISTNLALSSPKPYKFPQFHHPHFLFSNKLFSFPVNQTAHFTGNHFPQCQNHSSQSSSPTYPHRIRDTQEAISHFLQQFEISAEDSIFIASNCPKYATMLIDSVRDLEEWNTWATDSVDGTAFSNLGFKEKVVYMAKNKGDNGKVAFLESLGLTLSSSINVARYLASESLPVLIHKVKYMKEMFFSGSDDKGRIGKIARRMVVHLSIPVNDDLQQTLSLFEKIEARRGGLDMLGSSDATFRYFIESFPRILLLPVDSHLKPVMELLESFGVPKDRLGSIFLLFPPFIIWDIEVIKRKVLAPEKIGAVDEDFGKMLLKYPWILSTSIQENYKEILFWCDSEKLSRENINKAIISWPHLLGCSTSKLKGIVDQFRKLGVKNNKMGQIIAKSPQLLLRKPKEFLQVVSFLENVGFDQETVGKILIRCPEVFATSAEKTLRAKIEFLTSMGVCEDYLPRTIKKYPELLVSDIDRTLLPRIKYLMKLGLTKKEVAFMVRRFSPLLGYSIEEVLRPKYEFLVNTMEKGVEEVVDYPRYFSYSLERKIKPRHWALKGRNVQCSLKEMLDKNDEDFAHHFMQRN